MPRLPTPSGCNPNLPCRTVQPGRVPPNLPVLHARHAGWDGEVGGLGLYRLAIGVGNPPLHEGSRRLEPNVNCRTADRHRVGPVAAPCATGYDARTHQHSSIGGPGRPTPRRSCRYASARYRRAPARLCDVRRLDVTIRNLNTSWCQVGTAATPKGGRHRAREARWRRRFDSGGVALAAPSRIDRNRCLSNVRSCGDHGTSGFRRYHFVA